MIVVELSYLGAFCFAIINAERRLIHTPGLLWVFWLVCAAWTSDAYSDASSYCTAGLGISNLSAACACIQASVALSWINWLIREFSTAMLISANIRTPTSVFAYWTTLLTLCIISNSRGRPIWKKSVKEATLEAAKAAPAEAEVVSQAYPAQPYSVQGYPTVAMESQASFSGKTGLAAVAAAAIATPVPGQGQIQSMQTYGMTSTTMTYPPQEIV